MKVCHITSSHPSKDTRIFRKECVSLAEQGFNVNLVVPEEDDHTDRGVNIIAVKLNITSRATRLLKASYKVYQRAAKENADIYHIHDPEMIFFGLLLKLKGKKVIYDVHEDVPRQILSKAWINPKIRSAISWAFEKFENFSAKKFDAVIAATPHITERFKKIGCRAANVNNYPILSELYVPDSGWDEKKKAVCFIGGINKIRGIDEMLEAISYTDSKLYLGGNFSPPSLKEKAQNAAGWEQVIDLGFADRKRVAETMAKSLAGLVLYHPAPNHNNAQPNKMFEYMSAGIPVIASHFDLWKEIVEGNDCGICADPLNPYEISNAINQITENRSEAERMGRNGRKAVEEKYNWDVEAEKLIELYKTL
ncbi:glycosyl transferase [Cytobacillus oceanisediminis 2691]|uniref:Glycosyl transferase n=1 Tax=Cytobacillus oceanisediminis 2691 TaxID=1196031 RepID=A0A160MGT1_9BACI|nr:glycosyl transferase [Cytobacillus oceanisediminis 2691]